MLDMRTVLVTYVVSNAICALVMAQLWSQNRRRSAGLGLWMADFVLQFVALLLVAMRGLVPDFVSMVVANTFVIGGTMLLLTGLERYLGRPGRRIQDYAVLGAFVIIQTYFAVVQPNLVARNINISLGLLFVTAEIAWLLLRRVAPQDRLATRSAGLVFVAYGVVSLTRVGVMLFEPRVEDLFRSGVFDTASVLSYEMLFVALTFALLLMVNRRLFGALQQDIIERERTEEELRRSEEKFSLAFHNIPDAITLTTADEGSIVEVNDRFFRMTGLTKNEIAGRSTVDLDLWADPAERDRFVEQLRAQGRVLDFETAFRGAAGVFPASASGEVIEIAGEQRILTVIHDLTERVRAEDEIRRLNTELEARVQERTEELHAANEELHMTNDELAALNAELWDANRRLEEATRAKSDFLAGMSHELRTPLNSIIGFSGVLLQGMSGSIDDEQRRQITMINNSGRHLLELINGVLDLAKVESGGTLPALDDVDIGALAREMYETVLPMAAAKGLEMHWEGPDQPVVSRTDGLRVGQVLLNLLGNAVKFTERGSVTTTVGTTAAGAFVAVSDSGCGIGAEDLERIFDDFYQVTPRQGGKSNGTGLGLAVSRRLAESLGTRIDVTSEPGGGSTFTLSIPDVSVADPATSSD